MEDRISQLPDHVLHDILSLLCEKDATKTGILSKHLNCVWNSFPILVFDEYEFTQKHKKVRANLCESIDRTMRRRYESSIFTERLDIKIYQNVRGCGTKVFKHLDSWIDCAVTLKLNQLILVIWNHADGHGYVLPQCVWNSKWLRVLKLKGCEFSGSVNTIGIGSSLRELSLDNVRIDESTFHQVISSCFYLENLRISWCVGFKVLNVVGLKRIHTVVLNLSVDEHSVSIEAPGLRSLRFNGDSSSLEIIIKACCLKKLEEMCLINVDIFAVEYEFDKLIPEFPWLKKLSLDICKLKESFTVSSVRLMSLSLTNCQNVKHIVLDACCLNQLIYRGDCRLDITWISASEEVEISHELGTAYHNRLYGISFDKIAMYLVNLWFCKFLTIIYDESKWIAPEALDGLSCNIEQLRIKITNWHVGRRIRRSCLLIVKEFLGMSRRPYSILIEVGNCKEPVASFMKLDFLYQHEETGEGQVINTNCVCGGSSCWRCCLGELQISHSLHAVRGRNARNLVKFVKDNALRLKKISYVISEDETHSQEFACCLASQMQINGHPRHLVLRFP